MPDNELAMNWPLVINAAPARCGICERPIVGSAVGSARLLLEALTRHLQEFHSSAVGEIPAQDETPTAGMARIAAERRRQVEEEGWTAEHDEGLGDGELAAAAAAYAARAHGQLIGSDETTIAPEWPWDGAQWKPADDPVRNLEKAGALMAAELDRVLDRGNRLRREVLALCDQAVEGDSPPFSEFGHHDALHVYLADFPQQQAMLGILRQNGYRAEESSQTSICVIPPWRQD